MINNVLTSLGLGEADRAVYLALMKQPAIKPSDLALRLSLPRTTVQNVLIRLERKGLALQVKEGKVLQYGAVHPENILGLLRAQKKQAVSKFDELEKEFEHLLPEIIGMMDSTKSIPQVRFFRGREGARQVLFDTLNSKTELKDFANIDAMFDVFQDINDEYVAAREKTKVTKRSLLLDTPFARKVYESGGYSPKSHKGWKWIPQKLYPFSIEMNIYDGKISYLTYIKEQLVGVIIENDYIYEMHNSIWNLLWDSLPTPTGAPQGRRSKRK